MHNFDYHAPKTLDSALALLRDKEDGKIIAGGMTLLPTLKQRLAAPSDLVDLATLSELKGVRRDGDEIVIGAMTTHADVAANADVQSLIPGLAHLASVIGDPAVRHRGTIGGSVANADPAADYPAAVVALNATIVTNKREIAGDDFFVSLFETALERDEIITSVRFPIPERAGYEKFRHPASGYAVVGVMVAKFGDKVRVGVTGAAGSAFRATDFEAALEKSFTPDVLLGIAVSPDDLLSDIHCTNEYRAHLVNVMARRAIAAA
ncbi:MAG: xanthine dehydrogenase family protein subunit M [Beijerinckiaceae bacterium]|nr:xanthine dehydrogenase family protein subunit M [Beijerinckiaceae bacterium]